MYFITNSKICCLYLLNRLHILLTYSFLSLSLNEFPEHLVSYIDSKSTPNLRNAKLIELIAIRDNIVPNSMHLPHFLISHIFLSILSPKL